MNLIILIIILSRTVYVFTCICWMCSHAFNFIFSIKSLLVHVRNSECGAAIGHFVLSILCFGLAFVLVILCVAMQ